MITLDEFRENFINEINVQALEYNEYPIDTFIDIMTDIMINDFALINNLEKCYFKFKEGTKTYKNMQIDGAYLDLSANVLNILIADYNSQEMTDINNEFINNKTRLMINFFENVLKGFFNKAEEGDLATQLAINIKKNVDTINKIHLFIVSTNKISKRVKRLELEDFEFNNQKFKVELDVIDIQNIYNSKLPTFQKEPIIINTKDFGFEGIQCIKADIGSNNYEAYLAIVPGKFLCDIYKKYGPSLLEANVESFLNIRGAVNKGIRSTILNERDKFFTYNNGISTIAKDIEVKEILGKGLCITNFTDFQIINGGQTTASLASADIKDKAPLDNIYVQMKLTIIKEEEPTFIHNISKYANSQNKVTAADLNSNHPFYIEIENFSRKIFAPPVSGQPYQTLWFFERTRGQYDQPKMSMSKSERVAYEMKNPKNQKFTKTELAKYLNSSYMKPYDVSWGAEVNLTKFQLELENQWIKNKNVFNELFYKELISKAILFKTIEKIISKQEWYLENKAYRAQLVTYTFAKLVYEVQKNDLSEIDYKIIWDKQSVPQYLIYEIEKISKLAYDVFYDADKKYANIGEYCKRQDCWEVLKNKPYVLSEDTIESLVSKEEKNIERISAKKEQKLNNSIMIEVKIFQLGQNYWSSLKQKGIAQKLINYKEIEQLDLAIKYCNGMNFNLSPSQANHIWNIKTNLEESGILLEGNHNE